MDHNLTLLCRELKAQIAAVSKSFTPLRLVPIGAIKDACTPMAQTAIEIERLLLQNGCSVTLPGLHALTDSANRHSIEFFKNVGVCRLLLAHVEECEQCRSLLSAVVAA